MNKLRVLLLAGNTLRARAYAQFLENTTIDVQVEGVFYGFNEKRCNVPDLDEETKGYFESYNLFIPDFVKSLTSTFRNNRWNYIEIENIDVNSKEVLDAINNYDVDIVVFAGYGGQLLKNQHFISEKKYLHMHPGKLPIERGSTTLYYSILNERKLTVTAFYMTDKIDDGVNILFNEYEIPNKRVDIDCWLDCVVRADCFIEALANIVSKEPYIKNLNNSSEEYYVIHPVLKHVALLSLKK